MRLNLPELLAIWAVILLPALTVSPQLGKGAAMQNLCIVELHTPSAAFDATLKRTAWTAVAHSTSGLRWLLESSSSCNSALALADIRSVELAESLIVTLRHGADIPERQVEKLGGMVTGKLQNVSVVTIAVPANAVSRVQKIRDVIRVQKDQPRSTNPPSLRKRFYR
jgi:hypothetical protein